MQVFKALKHTFWPLGALGAVGTAKFVALQIHENLNTNAYVRVNDYLTDFFWYPDKPLELLTYCLSIITLFIYFLVSTRFSSLLTAKFTELDSEKTLKILFFIFWATCNLILFLSGNGALTILWVLAHTFIFLNRHHEHSSSKFTLKVVKWLSIGMVIAFPVIIVVPFIFFNPIIVNEFWKLPTKTILTKSPDGQNVTVPPYVVDTQEFLNTHKLISNYLYSPENDAITPCKIDLNPDLSHWINDLDCAFYDEKKKELVIVEIPSDSTYQKLVSLTTTPEQKVNIQSQIASLANFNLSLEKRIFSPQEIQFIKKNRREVHIQTLNRSVLHHHAHMFGPMNEMALGKPTSEIFYIYGYLNNLFIAKTAAFFCEKMTFEGYVKVFYSVFPLYYFALLFTLLFIFKKFTISILITGVSLIFLGCYGFDLLMLGPGINPIRYCFHLPVLALLWAGLNTASKVRYFYLMSAMAVAWLSMLNNREFGLFLSCSCVAAWGTIIFLEKKETFLTILCLFLVTVASIILFTISQIGSTGYGEYLLRGLLGFPFFGYKFNVAVLFFMCISFYLLRLWDNERPDSVQKQSLAIFLLILSACNSMYFAWNPQFDHLLVLGPTFSILLYLIYENSDLSEKNLLSIDRFLALTSLALVCLTFKYASGVLLYYSDAKSHVLYEWDFPRMHVKSTIDPSMFKRDKALIQRYSSDSDPGIYLLSKYDFILPFISDRYSKMVYPEMGNFLISRNEEILAIKKIIDDKPLYLFIDNDFDKNPKLSIVSGSGPFGYLRDESVWRARRIQLIIEIANSVRGNYEEVERGSLLTVYKLK